MLVAAANPCPCGRGEDDERCRCTPQTMRRYEAKLRFELDFWGRFREDGGTDAGYAERFMGAGDGRVRFVGHCIGLELNEPPYLARGYAQPLESGNVIAIEPKLAFTGLGAVGVENTYFLGEDGPVQLDLAQIVYVRSESDEPRVGFGS